MAVRLGDMMFWGAKRHATWKVTVVVSVSMCGGRWWVMIQVSLLHGMGGVAWGGRPSRYLNDQPTQAGRRAGRPHLHAVVE